MSQYFKRLKVQAESINGTNNEVLEVLSDGYLKILKTQQVPAYQTVSYPIHDMISLRGERLHTAVLGLERRVSKVQRWKWDFLDNFKNDSNNS